MVGNTLRLLLLLLLLIALDSLACTHRPIHGNAQGSHKVHTLVKDLLELAKDALLLLLLPLCIY